MRARNARPRPPRETHPPHPRFYINTNCQNEALACTPRNSYCNHQWAQWHALRTSFGLPNPIPGAGVHFCKTRKHTLTRLVAAAVLQLLPCPAYQQKCYQLQRESTTAPSRKSYHLEECLSLGCSKLSSPVAREHSGTGSGTLWPKHEFWRRWTHSQRSPAPLLPTKSPLDADAGVAASGSARDAFHGRWPGCKQARIGGGGGADHTQVDTNKRITLHGRSGLTLQKYRSYTAASSVKICGQIVASLRWRSRSLMKSSSMPVFIVKSASEGTRIWHTKNLLYERASHLRKQNTGGGGGGRTWFDVNKRRIVVLLISDRNLQAHKKASGCGCSASP